MMISKATNIFLAACNLLLLLQLSGNKRLAAANAETVSFSVDRLPSIWDSALSGTYHALYQLEMINSDEVLTLEEWASYNRRLFRLDLIGADGRTSYLTNGETGELLRYKPFVCDQIDARKAEDLGLIAQLFLGYEWDEHRDRSKEAQASSSNTTTTNQKPRGPLSAYGLGPLWLRANRDAEKIEYTKSKFGGARPLDDYDEYEVTLKKELVENQLDYKLRFYFVNGERFVKFIDWMGPPSNGDSAQQAARPDSSPLSENIQARALVIQVDYRNHVDESVFDIPIGYGCPRLPELDLALDIEVGQMVLHQGGPNQATFEVITSGLASDAAHSKGGGGGGSSSGPWISQRYSMRMLRLSKSRMDSVEKTESYYATLMQFRDNKNNNNNNSSLSVRAHLRRIKRVWWAPDSARGLATVYTIDQTSGECLVEHQDVRNQILLNFAGAPLSQLPGEDKNARAGGQEREEVLSSQPMVISVDQIAFLFSDELDYHLISLGETFGDAKTSGRFRNRVYEKRVHNFKLMDGDGAIGWRGPVSIVKQISTQASILDSAAAASISGNTNKSSKLQLQQTQLSRDYRTKLTILFYSDDTSRLEYKASIDLLDNHEVSFEYAHEQLDVSSCFASDDKQVVVVKYPLESVELSRILQEKQAALRSSIFLKLFFSLGSAFSTLQIYAIEPTFDAFNMRLQMSILDMPLTHTFQLERGFKLTGGARDGNSKLSPTAAGPAFIRTTSSSADACADHCEHYNCLRFSFDSMSHACVVELIRDQVKVIESQTSELYTYLERRETNHALSTDQRTGATMPLARRAHFSANSIIEYLDELVDAAANAQTSGEKLPVADADAGTFAVDDNAIENMLVLKLDLTPNLIELNENGDERERRKFVTLWPSALEHDLENMQEYSRELEELTQDGGSKQQVIRVSAGRAPRLQYNILLEDRIFDNVMGVNLEGVTYEECERQCELSDCRSFSYCLRDETCSTSWQHNEKFIRSISKAAPQPWQCNVYSLDYLSKFESYGRAPAPLRAAGHEDALSASDCANACMDQRKYQCQGFFFCRLPPTQLAYSESFKCYLVDWHVNNLQENERQERFFIPAHLSSEGAANGEERKEGARECEFYSRSFLAQFDKYLGRQLDLKQSSEMGLTIRAGLDTEFCAKQCLKMDCLGFDACPESFADESSSTPSSSGGRLHATSQSRLINCHLAVKSLRSSQLKREKRCTTFVLSDKSHFNEKKLKLIQDDNNSSNSSPDSPGETLKPDAEANIGRNAESEAEVVPSGEEAAAAAAGKTTTDLNGRELELLERYGKVDQDAHNDKLIGPAASRAESHWLGKIFSLILGVFLGFGFILTWNEAYARGWLDKGRARLGFRA